MKTVFTSKLNTFNLGRKAYLGICLLIISTLSSQNINTILTENWENSTWIADGRTLNTYDGNNHLTNSLSQTWDSTLLSWTNAIQLNYTNNPNGTVNQMIAQIWMTDTWSDSYRTTFTYNAFNKELTAISDIWVGTDWMPTSKQTNTYDTNQYLTNSLRQSWDFITSNWTNSTQSNYTNNSNGTVAQVINQSWNTVGSSWDNVAKTNYTYNASDAVLTAISQTWTGSWVNDTQITNTYNGPQLTTTLSQDWDLPGSVWVNNALDNYTYNGNGTLYQIVNQLWTTGAWVNNYRATFTYSPLATVSFDYQKGIKIYPNPTQDYIMIQSNPAWSDLNYMISDTKGKTCQTGTLNGEETTIDIHALAAGIYLVKIGASQKNVFKIIKN